MGIQYSNITLHGVNRETSIDYLSQINRDAYVSPTINEFTTIYDKAADGPDWKAITQLVKLDSKAKVIRRLYGYGTYFALVCLARHLSEKFSCSALAVHVYDGSILWYHLSQNGKMLDEYTTCGDYYGQPVINFNNKFKNQPIQGGNSKKLCEAFSGKSMNETEVETILRKPNGTSSKITLDVPYYSALLAIETYSSPVMRHEALARALGICPGLVLGLNYMAIETGELVQWWEDFRELEDDNTIPTFEEIDALLIKTPL